MFFGSSPNKLSKNKRALSKYSVGAQEPGLAFDFVDNVYQKDQNKTVNFSGAITHSRSGNAVMTDSDGYLKWAPHNLLTYSEQFDQWTLGSSSTLTTNYADAPNGEQTAERLVFPASGGTFVSIGMGNKKEGVPYTFAVFVKATGSNSDFGLYSNISGSITNSSTFTATNAWQLFEYTVTAGASGVTWGINNGDDSYASDILVWGAHVYRSDLGGMAGNPDQPPSRASYVPTTSSAVYLPRIGHHVYNGSAWVNEGLLAESESRTNLITYSNPDNSWTKNATTLTLNDAVSPDGTENATKITESATSSGHYVYSANVSFTSGSAYTLSAYLKAGTKSIVQLVGTNAGFGSTLYGNFDLTNGVVGSAASGVVLTIESVGNGWYRCSITGNATSTASGAAIIIALIDDLTDTRLASYTGSTSNNLYVYGTQTEQASTPSSLIPTSGSSVTRAAETFTIPSANLPWPDPVYIGSERLTGSWATPSGYDSTTSGTGTSVSVTGGTTQSRAWLSIDGVDTGEVYYIDITISNATAGGTIYLRDGASPNSGTILLTQSFTSAGGTFTGHVAAASNDIIVLLTSGVGADFDATVSVREIDPLSVSIAMDGRMTYADIDAFDKPKMFRWYDSATDRIFHSLDTNNGTGEPKFVQEANNVFDAVQGDGSEYAPDVLVPFNMASRHGSTFLNGAVDGVALTEDTTPTELPDLSATDLSLAYDYMGTIGTFRVWDRDITDNGLVEATNPSLEPSLSLEFSGLGTNSFVIADWSE